MRAGSLDGSDSKVYISLIGSQAETERFILDRNNEKSRNKNLFEAGNCDEFEIKTNVEIDKLRQIRIGVENGRSAKGWHLDKIELLNKRDDTQYIFMCNDWLSDDAKLERILPEPKEGNKNQRDKTPKLIIPMRHEEVKGKRL